MFNMSKNMSKIISYSHEISLMPLKAGNEQTLVSKEGIRRVSTNERMARISFIQKYIKPKYIQQVRSKQS